MDIFRIALQDLLRIRANLFQQYVQRFFQLSLLIGSQYAYRDQCFGPATEPTISCSARR